MTWLLFKLAGPNADGQFSCGLISDYVKAAVKKARIVIAEINHNVPFTAGETLTADDIDIGVETDQMPVTVAAAKITELDQAIAKHCAAYITDGCVIQTGVGAVPDAILRLLGDRKDLGVHSGMLGDGLVELIEQGVITNARKKIDPGVTINGALIGSQKLYDFANENTSVKMCATDYTHNAAVLDQLDQLVTLNSALEVDLTGQVNAEQSGATYLGGTGGQVGFLYVLAPVRAEAAPLLPYLLRLNAANSAVFALRSAARLPALARKWILLLPNMEPPN